MLYILLMVLPLVLVEISAGSADIEKIKYIHPRTITARNIDIIIRFILFSFLKFIKYKYDELHRKAADKNT